MHFFRRNRINNDNQTAASKRLEAEADAQYNDMSWPDLASHMIGDGVPRYLILGIPDCTQDAHRLRVLPNITTSLNNVITTLHNNGVQILDVQLTQSNEPREYGMSILTSTESNRVPIGTSQGLLTGAYNSSPDNRTKSGRNDVINLYVLIKYRYNAQRYRYNTRR